MTPDQVQARWDRQTDAENNADVALRVMGWRTREVFGTVLGWESPLGVKQTYPSHYTTDHNHAHEALATFSGEGWMWFVSQGGCSIHRGIELSPGDWDEDWVVRAKLAVTPAAISLACLMAMECEENADY